MAIPTVIRVVHVCQGSQATAALELISHADCARKSEVLDWPRIAQGDNFCFDLAAVASFRSNQHHQTMTASMYANPHNKWAVVNRLSAMVPGATEIDLAFNVNVTTGAGDRIMGLSGGQSDTAAGAQLAIVTTPGETIDVLITEAGVGSEPAAGRTS